MHDNQQFHWLYGIDEIFTYFDYDKTQLKWLTETILRGNMDAMSSLIQYDPMLDESTRNIRMKVITEYWQTTSTDIDVLQYVTDLVDDVFLNNVLAWLKKYPDIQLHDHFGRGQIKSKLWFVDILIELIQNGRLGNVALYGGWYATINWFLTNSFNVRHTYNFEIDPNCLDVSAAFNTENFTAIECDVIDLEWVANNLIVNDMPTKMGAIINTSAEHMDDKWFDNIPQGQFVILQTNNFFECDQHVNCVTSLDDVKEKYQMSNVIFIGELETMKYTRFMIAGIK